MSFILVQTLHSPFFCFFSSFSFALKSATHHGILSPTALTAQIRRFTAVNGQIPPPSTQFWPLTVFGVKTWFSYGFPVSPVFQVEPGFLHIDPGFLRFWLLMLNRTGHCFSSQLNQPVQSGSNNIAFFKCFILGFYLIYS